jgi:hypothetical protein
VKHLILALLVLSACASRLKVEPVKVEPIHMTIDVNIHDSGPQQAKPPGHE